MNALLGAAGFFSGVDGRDLGDEKGAEADDEIGGEFLVGAGGDDGQQHWIG